MKRTKENKFANTKNNSFEFSLISILISAFSSILPLSLSSDTNFKNRKRNRVIPRKNTGNSTYQIKPIYSHNSHIFPPNHPIQNQNALFTLTSLTITTNLILPLTPKQFFIFNQISNKNQNQHANPTKQNNQTPEPTPTQTYTRITQKQSFELKKRRPQTRTLSVQNTQIK